MGTWGAGSFDSDMAEDWLDSLLEGDDDQPVRDALEAIEEESELDEACAAIAAAEVVAAVHGRRAANLPEELADWLQEHAAQVSPELVGPARRALDIILDESELKGLWEEEDPQEWNDAMSDLQGRLQGNA